jgi:hypothetical protein
MDESDTVEDMQELARNRYRGRLRDSREEPDSPEADA